MAPVDPMRLSPQAMDDGAALSLALHPSPAPRLLDEVRSQVRYHHYSIRTEEAYVHWVRAYVRFHDLRHPAELSRHDIEAFLTWLADEPARLAVDPQSGPVGAALSLPEGAAPVPALVGRHRPPASRTQAADGAVARRGGAPDRQAGRHQRRSPRPDIDAAWSHGAAGSTAPACVCSKCCACASRTSNSTAARSSCAKARAPRTAW